MELTTKEFELLVDAIKPFVQAQDLEAAARAICRNLGGTTIYIPKSLKYADIAVKIQKMKKQGKTNNEIALHFGISAGSVQRHLENFSDENQQDLFSK